MALNVVAQIIVTAICCVGSLSLISGIFDLVRSSTCKKIEGRVVDYTQEYTSRGFLWKARIEYEFDNSTCFYITRARILKRGSNKITLYVNEKGKIIEKGYTIEKIAFGLFALIVVFVFFMPVRIV